jgi:hypothetical protein
MIRVRAWQAALALSHRRLSRVTGRASTFPGAKRVPPPSVSPAGRGALRVTVTTQALDISHNGSEAQAESGDPAAAAAA